MTGRWSRIVPLTGLAVFVLVLLAFLIGGETPDTDESGLKVLQFYADNESSQFIASFLLFYGSVLLIFFAGVLRDALRGPGGGGGGLPSLVFGGGLLLALGMLIFAGLTFALADAHEDLAPAAAQSMNLLNSDLFFPLAAGNCVFLLASGIIIVGGRQLPVWLGWVAVVLGIASATPAGFFAFLLGGVWIAIVSVLLARGATAAVAPPPPPPPPAAAPPGP